MRPLPLSLLPERGAAEDGLGEDMTEEYLAMPAKVLSWRRFVAECRLLLRVAWGLGSGRSTILSCATGGREGGLGDWEGGGLGGRRGGLGGGGDGQGGGKGKGGRGGRGGGEGGRALIIQSWSGAGTAQVDAERMMSEVFP